jgi:hypothetical protein
MNTPKITAFTVTKTAIIISYQLDGVNEISAIIEPFVICTYLVDLHHKEVMTAISDRQILNENLYVEYQGKWHEWRGFLNNVTQEWWEVRGNRILERHLSTEAIKTYFFTTHN